MNRVPFQYIQSISISTYSYDKNFLVKRIILHAISILGSLAVNRNERNILRSQERNFGDGCNELDQDIFDAPEETCTEEGWGEEIDSWDIVIHNWDDAKCGKHKENMKCLRVEYFPLGAILPTCRLKFFCESYNEWI